MSIRSGCAIIPLSTQAQYLQIYQQEAEKAVEVGVEQKKYWDSIINNQIESMNKCTELLQRDSCVQMNLHSGGDGYQYGPNAFGFQRGRPGSIEHDWIPPFTDWVYSPLVSTVKQIWDLSYSNPILLMRSNNTGYLNNEAGFFKRNILYKIASLGSSAYASAPKAKVCWDNMGKVDEFFNRVFTEHPIDIENNRFRSYINDPEIIDNAM